MPNIAEMTIVDPVQVSAILEVNMSKPVSPKVPITPPEEWVDQYGDYLYGFAMSRLRNPELAQDCVQDTFLAGILSLIHI